MSRLSGDVTVSGLSLVCCTVTVSSAFKGTGEILHCDGESRT